MSNFDLLYELCRLHKHIAMNRCPLPFGSHIYQPRCSDRASCSWQPYFMCIFKFFSASESDKKKNSPPGKTHAEVRISVFCLLFYGSSNRCTNKQKISKMKETRRRSSPADPGQTEACCLLSLSASHLLLHNPKAASSPPR